VAFKSSAVFKGSLYFVGTIGWVLGMTPSCKNPPTVLLWGLSITYYFHRA